MHVAYISELGDETSGTTPTNSYPVHPAAELFPLLDEQDLYALAEDIARNGLQEPLSLYDDPVRGTVLLDGRNRMPACAIAGVEPRFGHYRGDDPVGFVLIEEPAPPPPDAWAEGSRRRRASPAPRRGSKGAPTRGCSSQRQEGT